MALQPIRKWQAVTLAQLQPKSQNIHPERKAQCFIKGRTPLMQRLLEIISIVKKVGP